jgi:hypothetical protein
MTTKTRDQLVEALNEAVQKSNSAAAKGWYDAYIEQFGAATRDADQARDALRQFDLAAARQSALERLGLAKAWFAEEAKAALANDPNKPVITNPQVAAARCEVETVRAELERIERGELA